MVAVFCLSLDRALATAWQDYEVPEVLKYATGRDKAQTRDCWWELDSLSSRSSPPDWVMMALMTDSVSVSVVAVEGGGTRQGTTMCWMTLP